MEILQNVCLAHLMKTSAKYQADWTETVGGVVQTRFCGQTDRSTDQLPDHRPIPVYPPQTSFAGV